MNDFKLSYENRLEYLFVKGKGVRNGFKAIVESAQEFAEILKEIPIDFILIDYSEVITIASSTDIFNLTRLYETSHPRLHSVCISIIINSIEMEAEKFWEDICIRRGFRFKIFYTYDEAHSWLIEEVRKGR